MLIYSITAALKARQAEGETFIGNRTEQRTGVSGDTRELKYVKS